MPSKKELILSTVLVNELHSDTRLYTHVEGLGEIYFSVPKRHAEMIDTQSADPFLLPLVWLAMERGRDLIIHAPLSKQLADSVNRTIAPLFKKLKPNLQSVHFNLSNKRQSWEKPATGTMTGFSGGVDSWFTAIRAIEAGNPYDYFLFTNTGQHGKVNLPEVFTQRRGIAENCAVSLNTQIISVDTNLDDFFTSPFQQNHTIRNAACGLLFQKHISEYHYSSTYNISEIAAKPFYDIAIMDPILLPALGTERLAFKSIGDEQSRIDKLRAIAKSNFFNSKLYVCTSKNLPIENCGDCFKCRRTLVALDILNLDDVIKNSFDLDGYRRHRGSTTLGLLANAYGSKPDEEVATCYYKQHGILGASVKVAARSIWFLKTYMPKGLLWRAKEKWPRLWA